MQSKSSNSIQAFWVGMGALSSLALGIVSSAILSRYFNKSEYGTYRQILYVYSTFLIIFSVGLPRVFAYFLPRYSLEEGKDIVLKVSKLLFSCGFFFSVALYVSSGLIAQILKNPELKIGLKYFSPIPMLLLPTLGIEEIFATYKKTIYIAIYNTITRLLMLLFIVLPVILFKGTYLYAIYGWIAVSIISLIIAYYFKGIPFKGIQKQKANLSYKEIFLYSIPLVTASLAGIAISSSDQFYISRYFGPNVFAEFSNGFIPLPFVGMVTSAASIVLMPAFSKIIHEKSDISVLIKMWRNALEKSAIIIYPLVIYFIFYANNIMIFIYSEAYHNSAIYFQISIISNFFTIIVFAPLLLSLGKTQFYSNVLFILAICTWSISYILIFFFQSPIVVAIFSTFMVIIRTLIFLRYSAKFIKVGFFELFPVKKLLILILHSIIAIIIIKLILDFLHLELNNAIELSISSITYIILLILSSIFFKIDYSFIYKLFFNYLKK